MAHVESGIELPAEPPRTDRADLVAGHLGHGLSLQEASALDLASVEIELCEPAEIGSRAEQPGVAGHPAQRPGVFVVDLAPHQPSTSILLVFGRCNAWLEPRRG